MTRAFFRAPLERGWRGPKGLGHDARLSPRLGPGSAEWRSVPVFGPQRRLIRLRALSRDQRKKPKRLTRLGRKTRPAFPLSHLRLTSPDFANGRGCGANRPFPAADPRDSPSSRRGADAGSGSPPPMPRLWPPIRPPPSLPVSWSRPGAWKPGSSGAGWTLAATRGGSIFLVADHTSELRPLAHWS
jgi:hypothetical protein